MKRTDKNQAVVWTLRFGLAFVFLYAAVSSLHNPQAWAGFLPGFLVKHINANTLLKVFAVYELALVAWLLSGRYARYAALLCTATLAGIVLSGLNDFLVTFRDIGLACMALGLAILEK